MSSQNELSQKELKLLTELFYQYVSSIMKIPMIFHYIIHMKYFMLMILVNRKYIDTITDTTETKRQKVRGQQINSVC